MLITLADLWHILRGSRERTYTNMEGNTTKPKPGDWRRRVKVNNAIRNGELHFFHAVEVFVELHGPEDFELQSFLDEGLTRDQALAAWVIATVCLSSENIGRAAHVWKAAEDHMANMKEDVPQFSLSDLREFAALFMARMWAAQKEYKAQSAQHAEQ